MANQMLQTMQRLDMFDRPFELSFEEGHRQNKLKKEKLDRLNNKDFYREEFNKQAYK